MDVAGGIKGEEDLFSLTGNVRDEQEVYRASGELGPRLLSL